MSSHSAQHATFVIERTFEFEPRFVFAAWADGDAKSRWFGGAANGNSRTANSTFGSTGESA
jgi:uncharacterized protein YndB with AHSA1/START domain